MLRVRGKPAPPGFEPKVKAPGLAWLRSKGLDPKLAPPKGLRWRAFWTQCMADLIDAYGPVCAYSGVRLDGVNGALTIDHFRAKSSHPARLAFTWSNYRVASLAMNRRKGTRRDVLDPFRVPARLFQLELSTGRIVVNPASSDERQRAAHDTILALALDSREWRRHRRSAWEDYLKFRHSRDLQAWFAANAAKFPFVFAEARRQGLA